VIDGRLRAVVRPLIPAPLRRWIRARFVPTPPQPSMGEMLASGRFDPAWVRTRLGWQGLDDAAVWQQMAAEAQRSPFDDGSAVGLAESARTVLTPDVEGRPVLRHSWRAATASPLQICVHVHAFYPDLLAEMLPPLAHLPSTTAVLVSVADDEAKALAGEMIDRHLGPQRTRAVEVVDNRGRNFAPLLTTFGERIREHDLVLHLHTKKSLYSGREQMEWRTHLTRALCATPAMLGAALSLFEQHQDVGLLFPSTYPGLPVWANHWLANQPRGRELLDRMGAADTAPYGYLQYPVGGMFWARPAALGPLLDAGLSIGDFEPEAGQTDRTLAHAVERAVAVSCARAGLRLVEFDYDAAQWRDGWTQLDGGRFGAVDWAALEARIAAAELVSFDVFDTVVMRPCTNPDVMQRRAFRAAADTEAQADRLFDARRAAEAKLRAETDAADVTIEQIYRYLAEHGDHDGAILAAAQQAEIEVEMRAAQPRSRLVELLRSAHSRGQRLIAITDTYLPPAVVRKVLDAVGLAGVPAEVYVSNAVGARKDSGGLWRHVIQHEATPVDRWLHIGDNEVSDLQMASDHGIGWAHAYSPAATAQVQRVGLRSGERNVGSSELIAGLGVVPLLTEHAADPTDDPGVFGRCVAGPLAVAFALWVRQQAAVLGIDQLWFVARDGYVLERVYRRLAEFVGSSPAPSAYVLSSRMSMIGAAHGDAVDADLVIGTSEFSGRFGDLLFHKTGFLITDSDIAAAPVTLPGDDAFARHLLSLVAAEFAEFSARRADAYRRYVAGLGCGPDAHIGVVDLGYSANSVRGLSRIVPNRLTALFAVTVPQARLAASPRIAVNDAFGAHQTVGGGNFVLDSARLFETSFSEHAEQFAGFVTGPDGRDHALHVPAKALAERVAEAAQAAQRGIDAFVDQLVSSLSPEELGDPIDTRMVLHNVEAAARRCCALDELCEQMFIPDTVHDVLDPAVVEQLCRRPWPGGR
jgi:FMN phosphatase YigB (HAD superfamily)